MVTYELSLIGKDCWSAVIAIARAPLLLFALVFDIFAWGLLTFSLLKHKSIHCEDNLTGTEVDQ